MIYGISLVRIELINECNLISNGERYQLHKISFPCRVKFCNKLNLTLIIFQVEASYLGRRYPITYNFRVFLLIFQGGTSDFKNPHDLQYISQLLFGLPCCYLLSRFVHHHNFTSLTVTPNLTPSSVSI